MKKRVIVFLLRTVLWRIVLWWCASWRVKTVGRERFETLRSSGNNYVVAFWHGSMLAGWYLHRPLSEAKVSALVSQSSDGEFLSAVLNKWKYTMIRGSSHIGGKEAMQLMTEAVERGSSLTITPDGPRGPRHVMKMGAIRVAQKAGVPLVLVGIASKTKRNLKSWDAFEVPVPFSTVTAVYGDPVTVPKELEGDPLDALKKSMEHRLNELTRQAELYV